MNNTTPSQPAPLRFRFKSSGPHSSRNRDSVPDVNTGYPDETLRSKRVNKPFGQRQTSDGSHKQPVSSIVSACQARLTKTIETGILFLAGNVIALLAWQFLPQAASRSQEEQNGFGVSPVAFDQTGNGATWLPRKSSSQPERIRHGRVAVGDSIDPPQTPRVVRARQHATLVTHNSPSIESVRGSQVGHLVR